MPIRFLPEEDIRSEDDIPDIEPVVDPNQSPLEVALKAEDEAVKIGQYKAQQEAAKEETFKNWYASIAEVNKLPENPDDPMTGYDYRRYFEDQIQGGAPAPQPDPAGKKIKVPAKYSRPGHPDYYQNLPLDVWTLEQTERFIKENPPATPEDEAKQAHFLEKKKQQIDSIKAGLVGPYEKYVYDQNQKALNSGKVYAHEELMRDPVKMGAFDALAVNYTKALEGFFTRPFGREPLKNIKDIDIVQGDKDHPIASATGRALGGIAPVALAIASAPETLLGQLLAFAAVGGIAQYGKEKVSGSLMDKEGSNERIVRQTVKSAAYAPLWYYTQAISLGGPIASAAMRATARGTGAAGIEKVGGATNQEAVLTGLMTAALSGVFELTPLAVDKINSTVKNKSLDEMSDLLLKNDDTLNNTLKANYRAKHGVEPNEQELKDLLRAGLAIDTVKNNRSTLDIVSAADKLRNRFKPVKPEVLGPEAGSAAIPFNEGDIVRFAGGIGRITKLAGKHALIVSTLGREIAVPLFHLEKTGLLPQEIPDQFMKDVPEEKKDYVKDLFRIENPDVVREFIRNDPHYQADIKLNEKLGDKAFIRADDEAQWPDYYKAYLKEQIEAEVPPPAGQPELIVWMGLPGSGKSQISKKMGLDKTHVQIDPDDAKFFIPETKENPALANHVQKESAYMADHLLFRKALEQKKNIIWPKIGKNPESLKGIFKMAEDYGYSTTLYFNNLSIVESQKRAYKRYLENKRLVSDEYIAGIGDDLTLIKVYDKVKSVVKKFAYWDVNVKYGEEPKLIEKGQANEQAARQEVQSTKASKADGSREAGVIEGSGGLSGRASGSSLPEGKSSSSEINYKATLPPNLSKASPKYGYQQNQFDLVFESDLDKAAYITAQTTPSARDADYLKFVRDNTGWTAGKVRLHGQAVRQAIKSLAQEDLRAETIRLPAMLKPKVKKELLAEAEKPSAAPAVKDDLGWEESPPAAEIKYQIEKVYDEMAPEEQAAIELEIDNYRKTPEGNLLKAIVKMGGFKPHPGNIEEEREIPSYLKNKSVVQTLDQLRGGIDPDTGEPFGLAVYGWVFDSDDELRAEILRQVKNPVRKVNRAELQKIIREAKHNKKYQAKLLDEFKGKERKFITSVKKSEITSEDLRKAVEGVYDPISNQTTLDEAKKLLDEDFNSAKEMVWKNGPLSRLESTIGMVLIRWYDGQGNTFEAKNLAEHLAARATESGQGVQALAMWSRLSPEGMLLAAQGVVRKARDHIKQPARVKNFEKMAKDLDEPDKVKLAKKLGVPYLDQKTADEIVKMAKEIQAMPDWVFPSEAPPRNALQETIPLKEPGVAGENTGAGDKKALQGTIPLSEPGVAGENTPTGKGEQIVGPKMKINREKLIAQALLLKKIAGLAPVNVWDKVSMVQTLAQLLNPKTFVRNLLGNAGFQMTENISDVLATALDVAASLRTGKRTVYLPSILTQAKGFKQGLAEGIEEALLGIDLKGDQSKFTLPRNGVFDSGVMGALEKTLRISLSATDRAFYQAAFNQSVRDQMTFAKSKGQDLDEPTEEMIERAHLLGLYRTFQDDNAISRWFVRAKRLLNAGGKWGFGDIALKYPKTPANILARGIEYSPFGLLKTAVKVAKPLMGQGEFDQEGFVRSASRAFTGSVLMVAFGAFMAALGIISGKRAKDKDVAATRENAGLREYQINASALKRFVMSGFDPEQAKVREDDVHFTYDWFLPNSIGVAMGANMFMDPHQNVADKVLNMGDRMLQASETLQEQPLVQGLKTLMSRQNIGEGISEAVKGIPASFVPTLLNQVRQLVDNTARNTKDPNYFKEVYNKAIQRVPGLSSTLPARQTPLGKEKEMYQLGSNNPFNVFLNPAFVTRYKPDPVSKMVLDIWETTGSTIQFPRVAQASIKLTGSPEPIELTPEQYTEYQKYIGNKTDVLFTILGEDESFMARPDEEKARRLQRYLTDINTAAKIEVLGYRPKTVPQNVEMIMRSIGERYQEIKIMEEDEIRSEDDVRAVDE